VKSAYLISNGGSNLFGLSPNMLAAWESVGNAGFSAGTADFQSLALDRNGTPPDTGQASASGLRFYGAMLNQAMDAALGEIAIVEWEYGP
jgi:hypothetical protein